MLSSDANEQQANAPESLPLTMNAVSDELSSVSVISTGELLENDVISLPLTTASNKRSDSSVSLNSQISTSISTTPPNPAVPSVQSTPPKTSTDSPNTQLTTPPSSLPNTPYESTTIIEVIPTFPDGSSFIWSQTDDQITISFPIPLDMNPKSDFTFECTEDTITCLLKNELYPRIKGKLFASINKFDSLWQIDKNPSLSRPLLTIHLEKSHSTMIWPNLIRAPINDDYESGIDPQSLYTLGISLHSDLGMPGKALEHITKAATKNCIPAQLKLAAWYEIGRGEVASIPVDKDPSLSLSWHNKAAELGNAEACYIVGTWYAQGTHGVDKSYVTALTWFKKCIEAKEFQQMCESVNFGIGILTKPQIEHLESIFLSAAFQAGLLLMEGGSGLGDPQPKLAADVWIKSAKLGHAQSAWNLSIFYLNGFGVERDIPEAVRLAKDARSRNVGLQLPPQLEGLSDVGLDVLVKISEELKSTGQPLPKIELLVQRAKDQLSETEKDVGDVLRKFDKSLKIADQETESLAGSVDEDDDALVSRFKSGILGSRINGTTGQQKRKNRKSKLRKQIRREQSHWGSALTISAAAIVGGVGAYVWYKYYRKYTFVAGLKTMWSDVVTAVKKL
ncbi:hypothetical protein HK098_005908 [Nowakowskiella sp. JEL0407]|nr:hypothetical protein HK098_005908 [Nowakowskiella sp. JEL0407]